MTHELSIASIVNFTHILKGHFINRASANKFKGKIPNVIPSCKIIKNTQNDGRNLKVEVEIYMLQLQ